MSDTMPITPDVLVIGAGPAGISAATICAKQGLNVTIVDQGSAPGGTIFRPPTNGNSYNHYPSWWNKAKVQFERVRKSIEYHPRTKYVGLDGAGLVLVRDYKREQNLIFKPRALIIAVGAIENVRPVKGAEIPGVVTVGALQIMLKETGVLPWKRIALAGTGPLLLAAAVQLSDRGIKPVAVLERGHPFRPTMHTLSMAAYPDYGIEAAKYWAILRARGIMISQGHSIASISHNGEEVLIHSNGPKGETSVIKADVVGLHDGIQPNDFGLPKEHGGENMPLVLHAGDCKESLGGKAAVAQGLSAGYKAIEYFRKPVASHSNSCDKIVAHHRAAQTLIGRIYDTPETERLLAHPDTTVLCRCENVTIGELHSYLTQDTRSPQEVKLNTRVGMGGCQGRFCQKWVDQLRKEVIGEEQGHFPSINKSRWPMQPITIADYLNE